MADIMQETLLFIMSAKEPSIVLRKMVDTKAIQTIAPEILNMIGCSQNKYHAYDVWEHTLRVVDATPQDNPVLRLGALFHDVGKPSSKGVHPVTGDATFYDHEKIGAVMTDTILSRLNFTPEVKQQVVHYVRYHFIKYESSWTDAAVRRWVKKVGFDNVIPIITLAKADNIGKGKATLELDPKLNDEFLTRIIALHFNWPCNIVF
jgi:tRNA nucleotidyltransferase (CCA-adding enzyme)